MENSATDRLIIFDTTLRDGEQSPGICLGIPQKLEIAAALDNLGVDVIEAGFPAASPGDTQAVSAVAAQVTQAAVCALARCVEGDIRSAIQALRPAARPRLHVFIATSPIHRKHKLKLSASQVMQRAKEGIRLALAECRDVEFSAEDATRTEPEYLGDVVAMAVEAGVRTINIPDTVGYTTPSEYARTIESVCRVVKDHPHVVISAHCHDDLGLAVANSLSGVQAGARQVECTINGIGERAGNAALEEIVMAVRTRPDRWPVQTRIRSQALVATSALVARHTGFAVPPNKAIVGANAFAHEAGIHQHGMLGSSQAYEIMRPEDVGARSMLVLGKHSGRHAFDAWLRQRGVSLQRAELDAAFAAFKVAADIGGVLSEAQILKLARAEVGGHWRMQDIAFSGEAGSCKVQVRIADSNGHCREGHGAGAMQGAVAEAISMAIGMEVRLVECVFGLQSQGDGTLATARVRISVSGEERTGAAVGSSEIEAVAHSIVDSLPPGVPAASKCMEATP